MHSQSDKLKEQEKAPTTTEKAIIDQFSCRTTGQHISYTCYYHRNQIQHCPQAAIPNHISIPLRQYLIIGCHSEFHQFLSNRAALQYDRGQNKI